MHLLHDLRLVLTSIGACLTTLQRRSPSQSLAPEIDQVHHLLETGHALVDEVLVSSAIRPIAPHVDLNAVLRGLVPILATIVGPGIDIRITIGEGDARVYGRRADVERILLNVADNSAKAMPSGGVLIIETELIDATGVAVAPDSLQLTILDNGPGVPEPVLHAAIDPAVKPRLDGTGFGLACVATTVARLGGRLAIESRRGRGTLVSILLPLAEADPRPSADTAT
jgi:signal transduction histidine kinase